MAILNKFVDKFTLALPIWSSSPTKAFNKFVDTFMLASPIKLKVPVEALIKLLLTKALASAWVITEALTMFNKAVVVKFTTALPI